MLNTSSFFGCSWRDLLSGLYSIYFIFLYGAFGATSTADRTIFVPLSCDAVLLLLLLLLLLLNTCYVSFKYVSCGSVTSKGHTVAIYLG